MQEMNIDLDLPPVFGVMTMERKMTTSAERAVYLDRLCVMPPRAAECR